MKSLTVLGSASPTLSGVNGHKLGYSLKHSQINPAQNEWSYDDSLELSNSSSSALPNLIRNALGTISFNVTQPRTERRILNSICAALLLWRRTMMVCKNLLQPARVKGFPTSRIMWSLFHCLPLHCQSTEHCLTSSSNVVASSKAEFQQNYDFRFRSVNQYIFCPKLRRFENG